MHIELYAFATSTDSFGCQVFLESLRRAGVEVNILGVGQPWSGWRQRMQSYLDAAREADRRADYVVFCDAYDVLANPRLKLQLQDLANRMKADNLSMLVGCETWCGGNCSDISWWRRKHSIKPVRYPNGGCMMATPSYVVKLWSWVLAQLPLIDDDQIGLGKWMNAHASDRSVMIDTRHSLVTNVTGGGIFNSALLSNSAFLHFPSPVTKLGLSTSYNTHVQAWTGRQVPFLDMELVRHILRVGFDHYPLYMYGVMAALLLFFMCLASFVSHLFAPQCIS